jgi:hypothetical protein
MIGKISPLNVKFGNTDPAAAQQAPAEQQLPAEQQSLPGQPPPAGQTDPLTAVLNPQPSQDQFTPAATAEQPVAGDQTTPATGDPTANGAQPEKKKSKKWLKIGAAILGAAGLVLLGTKLGNKGVSNATEAVDGAARAATEGTEEIASEVAEGAKNTFGDAAKAIKDGLTQLGENVEKLVKMHEDEATQLANVKKAVE